MIPRGFHLLKASMPAFKEKCSSCLNRKFATQRYLRRHGDKTGHQLEERDILLSIPSPHLLLSSLFLVMSNTFSEFPFWKFFCPTLSLYFVFRFHAQDRGSSNVLITRVAWVRSNGQLAGRSTTQALRHQKHQHFAFSFLGCLMFWQALR